MKNLVKLVFGLFFTLGIYVSANAQADSTAPADDAIVCKQVAEDVFDCYVQEDLETEEDMKTNEESEGRDEDLNTKDNNYNNRRLDEKSRQNQNKNWDENDVDESGIDNPMKDDSYKDKEGPIKNNPTKPNEDDGVHMNGDRTQDDEMYEYQPDANDDGNGPSPVRL
jgi:Skp family chaperone for outer membrane proteins